MGADVGVGVALLDGVVWATQQVNQSPNRRPNANCCLLVDFSMMSAAREEEKEKRDLRSKRKTVSSSHQ